jgi:cytochrome c biogenesis protein CcmG/thiol:disulfide interchange protein DsbE
MLPIAIFAALAAIFAVGLRSGDRSTIPSVLIDKPAPEFALQPLQGIARDGQQIAGLSTQDLTQGKVTVVNVWASWCVPCRQEHPLLMELARDPSFQLVGINYKDKPENARRFLGTLGNPYEKIGTDDTGSAAVDWGVYGVPESFIVDGKGIIRYKWIGPLNEKGMREELLPQIRSAQGQAAQ